MKVIHYPRYSFEDKLALGHFERLELTVVGLELERPELLLVGYFRLALAFESFVVAAASAESKIKGKFFSVFVNLKLFLFE